MLGPGDSPTGARPEEYAVIQMHERASKLLRVACVCSTEPPMPTPTKQNAMMKVDPTKRGRRPTLSVV